MNLITGATGHIGNVLVRELLNRGQKVRALLLPGEDCTPLDGLDVEMVEGDVLDFTSLVSAFEGAEYVYHLAGLISIMPGKNELVNLVNVCGTRNVLHAARLAKIRRLVYTSSIHAIRRAPHGVTIDETIPFDPKHAISAYDTSKALASLEVIRAVQGGMDAVIVCPTGVIGPFDYRVSEMGQVILSCAEGKPAFYIEGAYNFVDVRDVVQGHISACEQGRSGETYILGGEQISVKNILDTVWGITGKRFLQVKIPSSLARFFTRFTPVYYRLTHSKPRLTPYSLETLASNSDISHAKAQLELGYSARPLQQSLADTVNWFLEHRSSFIRRPLASA
jgi:nucleoside-diphosphate-sugar epimerase